MFGSGHEGVLGKLRPSRMVGLLLLTFVVAVQVFLGDDENVPWRHDWWDALHKSAPRDRGDPAESPVVIVAIDSETMLTNGAWPWSRDKLAELVNGIAAHGASVIAFDIILSNPDPQSPIAMAAEYRAYGRVEAADALESIGDTDAFFARIIRDGFRDASGQMLVQAAPVVLPVTGIPDYTDEVAGQGCDYPKPAVDVPDGDLGLERGFSAVEPPLPMFIERRLGLQEAALAAINFNASSDFVVRRVKAVQRMCGDHFLLLGPEALRVGNQQFRSSVERSTFGMEVHLGTPGDDGALSFPVETNGDFWLHFGELGTAEEVAQRYLPALSLFDPNFDSARIAGKIVLLAVVDLGRIDERKSPLGDTIWGIEAHAQMIEQIAAQDFLRRPWFMFAFETLLLAGLALLIILFVPRAPPARSLVIIPLGICGLLAISWFCFKGGLLIDLASPAIGLSIVSGGVIGLTLVERDRARLMSEIELQSERADRSFLQGELDAAARIQSQLLPPRRFEIQGKVDLACYIDPARQVGGDFYDHAMVDETHLFFLVADVSGKGADASQFMLLSKTLWKSTALRLGSPLDEIVQTANSEITRENTATMFVTGLCGLLDVETRVLSFSSAGHDSPYLFGDGQAPRQLDDFSGPPAGLVDDLPYPVGEVQLSPGDRICVFTDGVTEAMDGDGTLYGLERLEAALAAAPHGLDSAGLVEHVVGEVRRFTGDAEQSDDLTLMIVTIP